MLQQHYRIFTCDLCGERFQKEELLIENNVAYCSQCYEDARAVLRERELKIFQYYCDLEEDNDGPSHFRPDVEADEAWEAYQG
jgi:hypothetical protein